MLALPVPLGSLEPGSDIYRGFSQLITPQHACEVGGAPESPAAALAALAA